MKTLNNNYLKDYSNRYEIRIEDLAFDFAKSIVFLRKYLISSGPDKEFVISRQILKSETKFWLKLLKECNYIQDDKYQSLTNDCEKIIKILVSIVNKVKKRIKK